MESQVTMLIEFGVMWLVLVAPLCAVVAIRNRYWPVYPEGHCCKCGYNLTGLPTPRCPECGKEFTPPAPE